MVLYILSNYNNYYNRTIKREESIESYMPYVTYELNDSNFVPNDGVNTKHTFGSSQGLYDGQGDYLVVYSPFDVEIVSRWFIIDSKRDRAGQYTLTLRRDLIADYYDDIIESPMFIEKAIIPDSNPLIFNDEGITTNQIKTSESLLKDETGCPWLVAYVSRQAYDSATGELAPSPLETTIKYNLDFVPNYQITSEDELSTLPFYKYLDKETNFTGDFILDLYFNMGNSSEIAFNSVNRFGPTTCPVKLKANSIEEGYGWTTTSAQQSAYSYGYGENRNYVLSMINKTPAKAQAYNQGGVNWISGNRQFASYFYNQIQKDQWNTISQLIDSQLGNAQEVEVAQYANQIIKIGENQYKQIVLESVQTTSDNVIVNEMIPEVETIVRNAYNVALTNYLKDYPSSITPSSIGTNVSDGKQLAGLRVNSAGSVKLTLKDFTDTTVEARLSTNTGALMCVDAPYDLITMPYSDTLKMKIPGMGTFTANKKLALATMSSLLANKGGEHGPVMDVQLLPYCPLRQFIDADGNIDFSTTNQNTDVSQRFFYVLTESRAPLTPIMYCLYSSATFDITQGFNIEVDNVKMNNQCDMYRLCSPNFSSVFEFNAAKNGGVKKFNVDFNYKPYTPYIHINPDFGRLYGKDFNDARGLICQGDFSITSMSDAFAQYELLNKNYQQTFQRQIENMETQHKYSRSTEIASTLAGVLSGAAGGALAGSMVAPGVGSLVGGIAGGVASLAGGLQDLWTSEQLRNEALDYTKDMFNMQLDNIKALPQTITKVGAFNLNYKNFPVLEYYTCTEEEKKAVANKIAYNGMTIGAIGTINTFLGNKWSYGDIESKGYIKGKLIRFESVTDLGEDFHLVNSIAGELDKGIYLNQ